MRGLETRLGSEMALGELLARPGPAGGREAGSCPDENSLRLGDLYVALRGWWVRSVVKGTARENAGVEQISLASVCESWTAMASSYSRVGPSDTNPAAAGPRGFEDLEEHPAGLQINAMRHSGWYYCESGTVAHRAVALAPSGRKVRGRQHRCLIRRTASHLYLAM